MGGSSKSTTQQQQQSTTQPYAPTIDPLNQIIAGLGQSTGVVQPTAAESGAISSLQNDASQLPDYTSQATGLLSNLFSGGQNFSPIASGAYSDLQKTLSPYTQSNYTDPTQTPGIQNVLDTIRNDVGNSVNGQFAGAGRDLSGANTQALARGLSQGEAVPLLNQYNQNVQNQQGAANSLFNAGGSTAGLLSQLQQTGLGNQLTGLATTPQIGNANAGAQATLQAGQTARGLPLSNLGQVLNLLLPIAGLGQQSQGTGTSNTTNQMSGAQQFATIAGGLGSLFGGAAKFSDRRLKNDIEQVGELWDKTPVYRFRYKDSPTVHLGLMADDVEKYAPESVMEVNGYKMVDYFAATERAVGAR